MPILPNAKHERFAQEIAKGKSASEAYVEAGYKANRHNAATLARTKHISTRVDELLGRARYVEERAVEIAAEKLAITKESVLAELAKIGFANMQDYMRASPEGDPYLDFSAITRDQAAALSEVTVEDFTDGRGEGSRQVRRVKFKLHDKKGALVDIGRELGMFVSRSEVGGPGDFTRMTADERRTLDDALQREIDRRGLSLETGAASKPH